MTLMEIQGIYPIILDCIRRSKIPDGSTPLWNVFHGLSKRKCGNIKKKISAALFRELFCVSEWSHDPMASHPRRRVPGDDECAGEGAVVCESGGAGDYYFNS